MKKRFLFLLVSLGLTLGAWIDASATLVDDPGVISWHGTCLDCTVPIGSGSPAHAYLEVIELGNVGAANDIGFGNLVGLAYWSELFPFGIFAGPTKLKAPASSR